MLSKSLLNDDQNRVITHLVEHDETIVVADTGEGKTIMTLTAIAELCEMGVGPFIITCPASVVPNWEKEAKLWEHTCNLQINTLIGDAAVREDLLNEAADAYVISLNSLDWLLQQPHKCEGIVIDELSKASGKQTSKLYSKKYGSTLTWRAGLTGTPVAQSFENIAAMCRIIDNGKTFGKNMQNWKERYGYYDYMGYNWTIHEWAPAEIMKKINHMLVTISSGKSEKLLPVKYQEFIFDLGQPALSMYDQMKKDFIAGTGEVEAVAVNEAVKSGKLRQIGSGFIYDDEDNIHQLCVERVECAKEWVEELAGRKGVIFYEYRGHLDQLVNAFPDALVISGGMGKHKQKMIDRFIADDDQLLLAQVHAMSHGVNGLQKVCSDCLFYHPIWSRDTFTQARDRLWRTGQDEQLICTTLIADNTLDRLVTDRVEDRAVWMKLFLSHVKS